MTHKLLLVLALGTVAGVLLAGCDPQPQPDQNAPAPNKPVAAVKTEPSATEPAVPVKKAPPAVSGLSATGPVPDKHAPAPPEPGKK